jgi:hypothetical protein
MDDLSKYSGEEHMQSAPRLDTNFLRLNGKKGYFELIKMTEPKVRDEKTGRDVYATENLGPQIDVIFLRIRRKLVEKLESKPGLSTPKPASSNEHNHKGERLMLWVEKIKENNKRETHVEYGTSDELRAKYDKLRTQQIVYVLYRGELVRLTVKGAALGSEAKAKDVASFYDYIASFKTNPQARDGEKDHFYDFVTELHVVEEANDMGEYYAMTFKRGIPNPPEIMQNVGHAMRMVYDFVTESDEYYGNKITAKKPVIETEPVIQLDEVEVDFNQLGHQEEDVAF